MNADTSEIVGKMVLSSSFGVGKIIGIEDLGIQDKNFLVIEAKEHKMKHYIPMDEGQNFRLISSEEDIKKIVKTLRKLSPLPEFENKKDRITYFKDNSKVQDIAKLAKLLRELNGMDDRGTIEKQIFEKIAETISLEFSLATETEMVKAKAFIAENLSASQQ
jgi:RNA polymerase-interacting CarD/CdnL/TRCF family regulator